jgi:hypothetical protein
MCIEYGLLPEEGGLIDQTPYRVWLMQTLTIDNVQKLKKRYEEHEKQLNDMKGKTW